MSEKNNREPSADADQRYQSVFRVKSDSTEPASPLNELRAEALAYGIALELEMQLDGTSVCIPAPGGLKPAGDTSLHVTSARHPSGAPHKALLETR